MTTTLVNSTPTTALPSTPARPAHPRLRGIDGLRALAVVLVIAFHLFPGVSVGGYVGVDVFFVISGFLITTLLVRERSESGRVRLGAFWARRARRLLPALALVVGVCSTIALLIGGDVLVGLPRQLLGAATFSYNWLDIAAGPSYFDASTPELLRNLWSLAVEEQFYLVWPLAVLLLAIVPRARVRAAIALGLATASGVWMTVLALSGADATRAYYGTDSHSFGLALGAAVAFALAAPRRQPSRGARVLVSCAGALSIGGIVVIALTLPADAPGAQWGGLQLAAVLSAVAVASIALLQGVLARVLDVAPLRWIGQRSYGLYLWHWPVGVLMLAAVPQFASDGGPWLLGLAATVVATLAAAASYRWIETPIRRDGVVATLSRWRVGMRGSRRAFGGGIVAAAIVIALVGGTGVAALVAPNLTSVEQNIQAGEAAVQQDEPSAEPPAPPPPPKGELSAMPHGVQITAIGDSVMLAVTPWLKDAYPGIAVNAKVSRQMAKAPGIVADLKRHDRLRGVLLIGLGTNGPIDVSALDAIRRTAGPDANIVLVNVQAPRGWTRGVNHALALYAAKYRNVELADWNAAIRPHLDYLSPDEIHAGGPKGAAIYLDAVADAFQRLVDRPPLPHPDWLRAPAAS